MLITVNNYRGLRRGDIAGTRMLVAGRNAQGKSSLCEAAAAALTGTPLPLKINKKDAELLVHNGGTAGAVTVRTDDYDEGKGGLASVAWPRAEVVTEGRPPDASPIAAGLVKLLDLDHKARAERLIEALGADPTREDLAAAIALPAERLDTLWTTIQASGWESAHGEAVQDGARLKGKWEAATGRRYGVKVAAAWRPDGWSVELETTQKETLQAAVAEATADRDTRIYRSLVDRATTEQTKRRLVELNETAHKAEEGRDALKAAEAELAEAEAAYAASPDPGGDSGMPCPSCGQRIRLVRGGGKASGQYHFEPGSEPVDKDEFERRWQAHTTAKKRLEEVRSRIDRTKRGLAKVEAAGEEAERLRKQLQDLEEGTPEDRAAGLEAVTALERAQARLTMVETLGKADAIAAEIVQQVELVRLLSPTGLRQQKLVARLTTFNDRLRDLAGKAEWPTLEITEDIDFRLSGRPEPLWSQSEHFRAAVLLQLALIGDSDLVIIDAADILDQAGRNGLFGLLMAEQIPALVTMTFNAKHLVPDLAAAGIGRSYWIEDGEIVGLPIETETMMAAAE